MTRSRRVPRVVIADGNDDIRSSMHDLLATLGVDIDLASSGGELVDHLTDERPVDLVITDARLPWMTGFQVALSARNSGFAMPFILLTTVPDEELRTRVARLGAASLLVKPVDPNELLSLAASRLRADELAPA